MIRYFSTKIPQNIAVAAQAKLPRSLIALSGEESSTFLNGMTPLPFPTSNRPSKLSYNEVQGLYSVIMNAKGRVSSDLVVYPLPKSSDFRSLIKEPDTAAYLLEVDQAFKPQVMKILKLFAMTSAVNLQEIKGFNVYGIWNDEIEHTPDIKSQLFTADSRATEFGYRAISAANELPSNDIPLMSLADYDLRRYLFGLPEGSDYEPEKSVPLEYCVDYMHGIDFHKGCYLGQELTCRMHSQQTVRKRVMPVVISQPGEEANISEDLYAPLDLGIDSKCEIIGSKQNLADNSPFGQSSTQLKRRSKSKPAGQLIAHMGNVGLALIRQGSTGLTVNGLSVQPITPFWWGGV